MGKITKDTTKTTKDTTKITKDTTKTTKGTTKITKNATLAEVLERPHAEEILAKFKVPCLTCPMAKMEMQVLKIGNICEMYGIDSERLVEELNK